MRERPGGADDQAHGLGQVEVRHDRLQPLAVGAVRNLPADAAAVRRVRHQHAIAAGEAEIGRQRRALVAALFLDDLDEKHLAALDHVLDLVAAAQVLALLAKLVGGGLVDRRAVRTGAGFLGAIAVGLGEFATLFGVAFARLDVLVDRGLVLVLVLVVLSVAKPLFLGGVLGFLAEQGFAIGLGDLVIIGVDFAEGQEAVAVSAIVDERRLERRFDPGDLG